MHRYLRPRLIAALVAMLLAAPLAADPAVADPDDPIPTDRIAGADRYETAAMLAMRAANRSTERVWLATGLDYPDALAAGATGEPVILVTQDTVPEPAAEALRSIDPDQVIAAGGPATISDAVLAAAGTHARADTARAAGADRFATSAAIARETHPDTAGTVWLATGLGFADALAAGPVAAAEGAPLLLAARDHVPASVRDELARLAPPMIVAVGGAAVLTDRALEQAAAAAGGAQVVRLSGANRFSTAVEVAERGRDRHGMGRAAYLATGDAFPDALAAGPAAASANAPLLLATYTRVPEETRQLLLALDLEHLVVAGGTSALSRTVFHRASRPWLIGACDLYDVTEPGPIQGHPENQRPSLDAWSGPWVIDDFRGAWGMAVPYRWRQDKVEAFEHRGVLFYVDTQNGYHHYLSVTVFCGNPFLMGGGVALDADDPQQIAARGLHTTHGEPEFERFDGPALYTAAWFGDTESIRFDYVAVNDDVILIHYHATNRYAQELSGSLGRIADEIAGSVAPIDAVRCPPNAADCLRR